MQCVSKKDLSQVIRYIMETAVKEMRVKEVDKVSAVIDMENLSMNQICNKRGMRFGKKKNSVRFFFCILLTKKYIYESKGLR